MVIWEVNKREGVENNIGYNNRIFGFLKMKNIKIMEVKK